MRNDYRDYLMHYGVKGMRWRHRKGPSIEERDYRIADHYDMQYDPESRNSKASKIARAKRRIRDVVYRADRSNYGVRNAAKRYNSQHNNNFQNKYYKKSNAEINKGNYNKAKAINQARFSVYDAARVADTLSTGQRVKTKKQRKRTYRKLNAYYDTH